jgi:hypothetical protein
MTPMENLMSNFFNGAADNLFVFAEANGSKKVMKEVVYALVKGNI